MLIKRKMTAFALFLVLALVTGCTSSAPVTTAEATTAAETAAAEPETATAAEASTEPAEAETAMETSTAVETEAPKTEAPETSDAAPETAPPVRDASQLRGIWVAYDEYAALGLSTLIREGTYRDNADRFLEEAQKYGIDTIFLHARAFDDAFWRSSTFHASKYLGCDERLTAEEAYKNFDPFGVFLEEAHRYGMRVHAWLNPYRVNVDYFYDPGEEASQERFLTAVKELLAYESNGEKVDGIHIDDYFYHAGKGYCKPGHPDETYAIVPSEEEKPESGEYRVVTPEEKREHVNAMIRKVYKLVKESGSTFGISPAGNYDYDMATGADIDTWLTEDGYLDYIIPQIYWSNHWGEDAATTMFTDRLDLFLGKRKNKAKFYVGLALYRTDLSNANNDPGWGKKSTILAEQIKELSEKGADGYVFFSAQYLFRKCAREELGNL